MEKLIVIELTEAELALVMEKREQEAKQMRLMGYVAEFNDLIARAKADGFVFATNGPSRLLSAVPWNNANKDWIKVNTN